MKRALLRDLIRSRYGLAFLAGLLLATAFPKIGIAGLGWIAPGCILFSAIGCRSGHGFRLGYLAGLSHYMLSLYWILLIPFPAGAVIGWFVLCAYLALYPAAWVWFCWKIFPAQPSGGGASFGEAIRNFTQVPLWRRTVWALACAASWAALEMIIGRLFSGFPWNLLADSQYRILPIIQMASVTGVYGISFLMVWFSVSLLSAGLTVITSPAASRTWLMNLILPLLSLSFLAAFGLHRTLNYRESGKQITAALIQPSIPQTLIWDPGENSNRFAQLIDLSRTALREKPDLLVWPEAAVPNLLRWDPATSNAVSELASTFRVPIILGADDAEPRLQTPDPNDADFYNSSFLIGPDGRILANYRKRKLVIFGEYIPFGEQLPFLGQLIPVGQGFGRGNGPAPFVIPDLKVKASVLICFEDIFPHFAIDYVEDDTDFLLNLTNDGWFGESAAQWQQAANAVFRAVENGVPLVRCTNNGLTCWIDPVGRMHDVYFPDSKDVYKAGFKIVQIPVLSPEESRPETFYHRYRDWFGWLCVGVTGGICAAVVGRDWRLKSKFPRQITKLT